MSKIVGYLVPQQAQEETAENICPVCGKCYKTQDGLAKHLAKEHPDDTPPPAADGTQAE